MTTSITIQNHHIGINHPPFIIAELSGNHNQNLNRALEIVERVAAAGAHALKLQTYTANTMTLDLHRDQFFIADEASLWSGKSLYQLYEEAHTPWEWHPIIFKRCEELGMVAFSTPFDETAVDFLESLNVPCYKISSFENTDIPLIRRVASTKKPLIISTGMATITELDDMVFAARDAGCEQLILLKCTSSYPAPAEQINLNTIPHLRQLFNCEVGLSDHTMGIGVAAASVALGASVIEKHVTLSRADGGVDAAFSLEPQELESLVAECKRAWQSLGNIHYGPIGNELKSLQFRRSLYVTKDLNVGEVFTKENLRAIRPGGGLSPKYLDFLLGKRVTKPVKRGTPVDWDLIHNCAIV